ncbi:hypothetical protein [Novosphingobium naphthalenivorans]|uniref:hypothetical protein n=1 Tax=Novosphingobium naphthalenivorans TaxID=273168 RepID=UPI00082B9C58|nr:hypothetical protein [Novosphingobium naphthalenivorans]
MLGQLVGAQFALERVIAELAGNPAAASALQEGQSNLAALSALLRQVATADAASLPALRAEIMAAVSAGKATAEQQKSGATTAEPAEILLDRAMAESRAQVHAVMAGMKDFDPYLHFGSAEDETEYRKRAEERQAYISQQEGKGAEGQLNASGAAIGQMADAYAHGAGDSPEFKARWDALVASTEKLRDAAKANGVSTEEFDRRLREDLRRILKSKGLSDAEIDAQFAAHPDPLEAVKAYVGGEKDIAVVEKSAEWVGQSAKSATSDEREEMGNLIASLQNAGIVEATVDPDAAPKHGVAMARTATPRTI